RNFEARIHQLIKSNYLMSPALVVIFALAGRINIDFDSEPVGFGTDDKPVYFKDLWPDSKEIKEYVAKYVKNEFFNNVYSNIFNGDKLWDSLKFESTSTFNWNKNSLYIKKPPFFEKKSKIKSSSLPIIKDIINARPLLILGDTITTDHISPAGEIPKDYPAGRYLNENKIQISDFNTYGSRRGNHEIMMRGTFANIRILNSLATKRGGFTIKFPEKTEEFIFDAAMEYKKTSTDLIVFGGKEYGTGSSRDWAAKGTSLLGVKAVIASSFERIHRSNLIGMGVLPLVFKDNQNFNSFNLRGDEIFTIRGMSEMTPGSILNIEALRDNGEKINFETVSRLDTEMELIYYQNGGILNFVLNKKKSLS
ncbi:MAG: aconitate hydratase, partial [Desulfobacteraceae bacterium]|nr:aconitate hydratase [Desulfobacteraceae bacterium]